VIWRQGRFPEDVSRSDRVCTSEGTGRLREVHGGASGGLDAIVSNPPYISSAEVEGLAPELREFEPRMALDGGVDGLAVIRSLVEEGPRLLRPGGLLAMEMADGQSDRVRALVAERRIWRDVEVLPDLAGIPRVMVARCAG